MLRCSTTSSVACEHKNWPLVNTRIPRWPLAVSPWHGSLAICWTLAVSPWEYSIPICSLSHHGKTPLPPAVSPWEDSLTLRSLTIAVEQAPTGRMPMGKPPCCLLVACCITVPSLCLRKETPPVGRLSLGRLTSRHRTLAYIVLSHFSNVQHSSRQCYPSLSLEHMRRLWQSSTLERSISFLHRNCPFNWHSGSCCIRGFTACIPLSAAASHYNIFSFVFVFYQTSKLKWHHPHSILWLLFYILCNTLIIMAMQNDWTKIT